MRNPKVEVSYIHYKVRVFSGAIMETINGKYNFYHFPIKSIIVVSTLLKTIITDVQQTQDHFQSKFIGKPCLLIFGKNKYKIIVYVHIFSWNTH